MPKVNGLTVGRPRVDGFWAAIEGVALAEDTASEA